jgi:peptidyl-Asp metalloendopeptidase
LRRIETDPSAGSKRERKMTKKKASMFERSLKLLRVGIGFLASALIVWQPGGSARFEATMDIRNAVTKAASIDQTRTLRPITAGMRRPAQTADRDGQAAAFSPAAIAVAPPRHVGAPLEEVVIEVMVAYTKAAARSYADIVSEVIEPAIEGGNDSFRLSGIGHVKLRLAHVYQTDYVESGDQFVHLWRFADKGDGYMDEIHQLRDQYQADVAVLIVDDADGCGLATRVGADEDDAFAVVHHTCAKTNFSLVHEIGHLIGASHERGYVHGNEWRDIMSYKANCGGCPRLPVWSNPEVLIGGAPAGSAGHDNARVIAQNVLRVASFR